MAQFAWSIDDAGGGGDDSARAMEDACRRFEERNLRATWFVVPKPGGNPLSEAWKRMVLSARDADHDIQLHGLTHEDCYEFGPPAWPATSIGTQFESDFAARREELMPRYTVAALGGRIAEGLRIFRNDLGVHPTVFRAPCGAISRPLYAALRDAGIHYESCMYISATGYEHLPHRSGDLSQKWVDTIPYQPFRWYSDIVQAPILNEYTWRGSSARESDFLALASVDIERIADQSPIVTILMHTHGIADDIDYAFRLVDHVAKAVDRLGGRFTTLGALATSGALDAAATVEGPHLLAV